MTKRARSPPGSCPRAAPCGWCATPRRDRYDRLLAYVYRDDGTFVNMALVDSGYATAYLFEPNITFADDFRAAEERARRLQSACGGCGGPDVPAASLGS